MSHALKRPVTLEQLKSWTRCPRQFELKTVRELRWPTDTRHFKLGQEVHKLLDHQARGLDVRVLLLAASPEVRQCWEQLQQHPISQWPVVGSEWPFYFSQKILGQPVWFTGRMDRISQAPDGRLWVIDWKTGTAIPKDTENDWQTKLYALALHLCGGVLQGTPNQLVSGDVIHFAYVKITPQEVAVVEVPCSTARLQAIQQELRQVVEGLLTGVSNESFPLPSACPDLHCGYRGICGIDALPQPLSS